MLTETQIANPKVSTIPKLDAAALGLFILVLGFYLYTLAPSMNWADGGRMQMDVMLGGSTYWFFDEARHIPTDGLPFDRLGAAAWDHPLYVMLGQLFIAIPWGEPSRWINLMSAVAGALAIALVYRLGRWLGIEPWAAALGALALAVSHTFWFHAVTSEVYTLNVVFMVSLIGLALSWPQNRSWRQLAAFAFLAGLGLANHLMLGLTLLLTGAYMIVMIVANAHKPPQARALLSSRAYTSLVEAWSGWRSLALVGLFLAGFAPWWIQFVRMARIIGLPLALEIAVGFPWLGHRMAVQSGGAILINLGGYLGWLLYQFTPIGVTFGIYGYFQLRREQPHTARLLLAIFISHILFSANYTLGDQFNFHLPSYVVFSLAIIWGVARLSGNLGSCLPVDNPRLMRGLLLVLLTVTPISLYALTPLALSRLGVTEARLGIQPIGVGVRDTLTYFLNPNKRGDDSAARFGRSTMAGLAPNALVLAPKTTDQEAFAVLRYFQAVEGLRPDARLEMLIFEPGNQDMPRTVLAKVQAERGCRPLYLASLHPKSYPLTALAAEFEIVPEANLFRLWPRQPQPPPAACPDPVPNLTGVTAEELFRMAMRW